METKTSTCASIQQTSDPTSTNSELIAEGAGLDDL